MVMRTLDWAVSKVGYGGVMLVMWALGVGTGTALEHTTYQPKAVPVAAAPCAARYGYVVVERACFPLNAFIPAGYVPGPTP